MFIKKNGSFIEYVPIEYPKMIQVKGKNVIVQDKAEEEKYLTKKTTKKTVVKKSKKKVKRSK